MMAKKSSYGHSEPKEPKRFSSADEIDKAIARIERRLVELRVLDQTYDIDQVEIVRKKIIDTMREIFGASSAEFERYEHYRIWSGSMYMNMQETYIAECERQGIKIAIKALEGEIDMLLFQGNN